VVAAFQVFGIATQADLAPLVTQAQLNAQLAPLATQAQLNAMQAVLLQQMQALLAPHNAPAIAAAAAATVQTIAAARAQNAHDSSLVPYAVVPRADGTLPPNWPAGFSRAGLRGPIAAVDALLADYGLAAPAGAQAHRDALAQHIGTMRF
jgi:hypothetical protein